MALAFLLDEHLRGMLWDALQRQNVMGEHFVDVICVGDAEGPPLGAVDEVIIPWAEEHNRILITRDRSTIPNLLRDHLSSGSRSPGVLMMRHGASFRDIIDYLMLASAAGLPQDFADRVEWFP